MRQLQGTQLLIVEDEILVAGDLAQYFEAKGATILGPAPTMEAARRYLACANAAILDVNIDGRMVFPIADRLLELGVPFVFFSGYDTHVIPPRLRHVDTVPKSGGRHALFITLSAARRKMAQEAEAFVRAVDGDIVAWLPELRAKARYYCPGDAAADRLVERTLLAAIDTAGCKPTQLDTAAWLCEIMDRTFARIGRHLLD